MLRTYEPITATSRGLWQRGPAPNARRCPRCGRRRIIGTLHVVGEYQQDAYGDEGYIGELCQACAVAVCAGLRPLFAADARERGELL